MKTALITGATGLIGKQLLQLLLDDVRYNHVNAITRKPLDIQHPKLENLIMDFDKMTEHYTHLQAEDVFCCLGTTMKQAGSKEAFKKVDYTYPLDIAKITKVNGAKQFLLVSALGANKNSSIYYNQVKGEVEEAIREVGFDAYHIVRPSLLLGPRTEHRSGEDAAKVFYKIFGFLIPKKYQAIDSAKVAQAMLSMALQEQKGVHVHESMTLQSL